jgi:GMP synthase (glutamine-hydrolysing)
MRKLAVFQHVPFEPLGTLNAQFKESGFRIRYVNFDRQPAARISIARYNGLVVLGGPMAADQTDRHPNLSYEKDAIREAAALGIPVLGICLGAQLIAASLGGRTLRGSAPEFGWTRVAPTDAGRQDPLIGHFDAPEWIFQWHSDTFTLPRNAVLLASSEGCAHQAFRIGERVYGLQFHLEADRALIRRWLLNSRRRDDAPAGAKALDFDETMDETTRYLPAATRLARNVFGAFVDSFYSIRRRRAMPSR